MAVELSNSRLMDQVADEILKPFQEPIHGIYIDADFLYDYRLGELILKIEDQKQFDYLKSCIPAYENGNARMITKYFPELKVTEQELDLLEKDPAWSKFIHLSAPRTEFLFRLNSFIAKVNTYNHSKELNHKLRININMRRLDMPKKIWEDLKQSIMSFDPTVDLTKSHYASWNEVPMTEYAKWSMMLIHDVVDFVKWGSTSQKMLEQEKLLDKIILSPYQTEEEFDDPKQEELALNNFAAIMTLMVSEFSFVRKSIPIER